MRTRFIFVLFLALVFWLSACQTTVTVPVTGTATATSPAGNSQAHGNTAPDSGSFDGCPAKGDGGSAQLNRMKNRTDMATWTPIPFSELAGLSWPKSVERKDMEDWSSADAAEVAKNNGRPVSIEDYLAATRLEGPETPNCHLQAQKDRDYHIFLVQKPSDPHSKAIIVEATPRVRANHPGWNSTNFTAIVKRDLPVRISGWTMLDPEHPDDVGQSRITIWEIHPIMKIEVQLNGAWVSLDDAKL